MLNTWYKWPFYTFANSYLNKIYHHECRFTMKNLNCKFICITQFPFVTTLASTSKIFFNSWIFAYYWLYSHRSHNILPNIQLFSLLNLKQNKALIMTHELMFIHFFLKSFFNSFQQIWQTCDPITISTSAWNIKHFSKLNYLRL